MKPITREMKVIRIQITYYPLSDGSESEHFHPESLQETRKTTPISDRIVFLVFWSCLTQFLQRAISLVTVGVTFQVQCKIRDLHVDRQSIWSYSRLLHLSGTGSW